ncbi:hypothetical protein AMTRI_Chr04g185810 [Amborella trichopoda]
MRASATTPLMNQDDIVKAVTDVNGLPAIRSRTGGWRSSLYIIWVEVSERFAYYGASSNLITYLTDYLNQSTVTAAKNVNAWSGVASLLPLLGAFVADSYLGRYKTIIISSLIYLLKINYRCLDKAAIPDELDVASCSKNKWRICTVTQVEEAKLLLRLLPIWGSCLGYAVIFAQSSTFFTKQGKTMDRYLGSSFQVPAAALQSFISLGIMLIVPFYDRIFVPIARKITSKPSGISMLQRIGIGMVISVISMVLAALVESKRLQIAKEHGLLDDPYAMVPMSFCWLIPQYLFFGMADVFTMVGLQEFFYNQMPDGLRSLGAALYLSIIGVGSFLSSAVITIVEMVSTTSGGESWFADNLNRAHLDYFYWLLAVLSGVFFCLFVWLASHYTYKRENLVL